MSHNPRHQNNHLRNSSAVPSTKNLLKGLSPQLVIVIAVCFSMLLGTFTYKIALSQKNKAQNNAAIAVLGSGTTTRDIIANALDESEIDALLATNATSDSPFNIQPGDTVSERVSKSLFSGYMYAKNSDGVTGDSATAVADSVVTQISQSDLPQAKFTNSQVKVLSGSSKTQIKQYGNAVGDIIIKNYKTIAANKDTSSMSTIAKAYKEIGNSLILVPTPADLINNHAALANSFILSAEGMEMLDKQESDPVQALLGLKTMKEVGQSQIEVLINIGTYFKKNDIIFTNSDSGSIWNQYINITSNENANPTAKNTETGN